MTSASPLTKTPDTMKLQCPLVCPGVGIALGWPGSVAAMSAVNACAVGMPSRTSPPLRISCTDHGAQPGRQMFAATSSGEACSRYSRLAWPTSSAWQNTGVPCVFANQIADAEVVDVGVGQQDRAHVAGAETQLRSDASTSSRLPGKPGVDQHATAIVG